MKWWKPAILLMLAVLAIGWWWLLRPRPRLVTFQTSQKETIGPGFSYDSYGAVLETDVDSQGLVAYQALKANRHRLDDFAAALGTLSPATYSRWTREEQIAFWINAYNSLTLEVIINHYPIRPSLLRSVIFPRNSIRQIPGVWTELQFEVMGRKLTLDHIEHQTLRKEFAEPRIHMALVCAGKGCPPLRQEPYVGSRLEEQFADQARKFLSQPEKFRIDRLQNRVYLSPLFEWFGGDFVARYGGQEKAREGRNAAENAVLNFLAAHLEPDDRRYLTQADYQVVYLDYDWSLNETTAPKEIS
ncbi:MAG: DUF547 domain-containing protein [Acidobacteriota bacterium]